MSIFRRRHPKPKTPVQEMAESIVGTVIDCNKHHIPTEDITGYIAGYLEQYELAIRSAMQIEKIHPLPLLKSHFDFHATPGIFTPPEHPDFTPYQPRKK